MKKKFLRKSNTLLYLSFFSVLSFSIKAQNVGINATGATPNSSAMLDLNTGNTFTSPNGKGLIIPNVSLTSTTDNTTVPVAAAQNSILVYNTNAGITGTGNAGTGYYYWNNSAGRWVNLIDNMAPGSPWMLLGNTSITTPAVPGTYGTSTFGAAENFLGTSDANDVVFGTNNIERMRIKQTNGFVGIGTSSPANNLDVYSGTTLDAIYGHSANVGGVLGKEVNITFGTPVQTLLGSGVYAANPTSGYTSSYSQSTAGATVAAGIDYSNVWIGRYVYVENASNTSSPLSIYGQLNNTGTSLTGYQIAVEGYNNRASTAGNPGYSVGTAGVANSQNQDSYGVLGSAFCNTTTRAGGYFESYTYAGLQQAYAYVGTAFGAVLRKITGTNAVSEIIPTETHGRILMTCPESPEYWYQDYGTVQLVNGKAHVDLDPILLDVCVIDAKNPIKVFTTTDDPNCKGLAIVKGLTGFDIIEFQNGTSNGNVDYQIILRPKTGYGEGRFPQAPGPGWLKSDLEPENCKAKNQTAGKTIFHWPSDWEVYKYDVEKLLPIGAICPTGPNKGKVKLADGVFSEGVPATKLK